MSVLSHIFKSIDAMKASCDIDYNELKTKVIDEKLLADFQNQRLINSFLFNYSKIQDKIGAKLFRQVLYDQKEIDNIDMPMKDVLNLLEKLSLIDDVKVWDRLREIRNNLAHEYPFNLKERAENIQLALEGYEILLKIYASIKQYGMNTA